MIGGVRVWRYHRPANWPRKDVVAGLDQAVDDEAGQDAETAPAEPSAPAAPATPAAAFLVDQGDDSAPF
jgi:putative DNA primase/helicase